MLHSYLWHLPAIINLKQNIMKNLFLLLTVFALMLQSCSSSDDSVDDPIITECETPTGLSASEITEVSAVLNWQNPNNVTAVNVEYGLAGFSLGAGTIISTSQNSISIDGLISDTSYDFYVQAICSATNMSMQSNVGSFTTNECQIPINLSVSEITADSAVLNWENNNDNLDVNVEYGLTGFSPGNGTVLRAFQNSISIGGLIPDTSYDFYVQAICSANNVQSEVGTFTTNTISPFAGTWSGTYSGDDSGTWRFVVSINSIVTESSSFSNNANATQQGNVGGMIPASGSWTDTLENGTIGVNQITGETLNGTWTNPTVSPTFGGTLTGSRE